VWRRHRRPARPVRQPDLRRVDEPGPHPGPDIVASDYTGWWIYILGPLAGAMIGVAIIGAVRGLPDKQERAAAQGVLRMQDTSTLVASQQETP
jgi:hypothetical protein